MQLPTEEETRRAFAVFGELVRGASFVELNTPQPPQRWYANWTRENGCLPDRGLAEYNWEHYRKEELARREAEHTMPAPPKTYDVHNPMDMMPWDSMAEAAQKLGYNRGTLYKWQRDPSTMPMVARRLMLFFRMAPPYIVGEVLKLTSEN